jgi:aspartate carbamoyltransferase regulatory subunit
MAYAGHAQEFTMATRFAHTLLFVCPDCHLPISISRISSEKSMESVDGEVLKVKCSYCEQTTVMSAVTAKKHYVEEWVS